MSSVPQYRFECFENKTSEITHVFINGELLSKRAAQNIVIINDEDDPFNSYPFFIRIGDKTVLVPNDGCLDELLKVV